MDPKQRGGVPAWIGFMVLVLLSTSVERVGVSLMHDFFCIYHEGEACI